MERIGEAGESRLSGEEVEEKDNCETGRSGIALFSSQGRENSCALSQTAGLAIHFSICA